MVQKEFLIYDYYYTIPCANCGNMNPALDFAEYGGTHPFQLGAFNLKKVLIFGSLARQMRSPCKSFPKRLGGVKEFSRLENVDTGRG